MERLLRNLQLKTSPLMLFVLQALIAQYLVHNEQCS